MSLNLVAERNDVALALAFLVLQWVPVLWVW